MHAYENPERAYTMKKSSRPYPIVNDGRALSYGHPPKPALTLSNHPIPSFDTKFDYSVPIMGQPKTNYTTKNTNCDDW